MIMDPISESCSKQTDGLILSSFEVLQNSSPEPQLGSMLHQRHRLNTFLFDNLHKEESEVHFHQQHSNISASSSNSDNTCNNSPQDQLQQHSCEDEEEESGEHNEDKEDRGCGLGAEAAEGDEMFDVHTPSDEGAGHFRNDEALDSFDHDNDDEEDDHSNDGHGRKYRDGDDGDDEDEDEDYEDERSESHQGDSTLPCGDIPQAEGMGPRVDSAHCAASALADLRAQQHFVQFQAGALLRQPEGWHSEHVLTGASNCYSTEWHLSLPHSDQNLSTGEPLALSSDQQQTHDLWRVDGTDTSKMVDGRQSWAADKIEDEDEIDEDLEEEEEEDEDCANVQELQKMHHHHHSHEEVHGATGHWVARQPHQVEIHHGWPKEMGEAFSSTTMSRTGDLLTAQEAQLPLSAQIAGAKPYVESIQQGQTGPWTMRTQLPAGPPVNALPHQFEVGDRVGSQQQQQQRSSAFYRPHPSQGCTAPMQVHSPWSHAQAQLQQSPAAVEAEHAANMVSGDHFHTHALPQHSQGLRYKACMATAANHGARELQPSKVRAALTQARHRSYPYHMKEEKKMLKDIYPASAVNMHSLKASHIVSWYIDYLIHENEHLTQISQAFSLPVNLFHSDDFYFMESLKKKVHFPSLKFLTWMQQNLPSININTVDFTEGRPSPTTSAQQAKSSTVHTTMSSGGADGAGNLHTASNGGLPPASTSSSASHPSHWAGKHLRHPHTQQHQHLPFPCYQHALHKQHQQQELSSWQNKSRRDIIHDVFFYFQHRRVTCQN